MLKYGGKLKGDIDILASEAIGLSHLYNVKMEYLFDDKLKVLCNMPIAYWHWYERNERRKQEEAKLQMMQEIQDALKKRPELMNLFKKLIALNDEHLKQFTRLFMETQNK